MKRGDSVLVKFERPIPCLSIPEPGEYPGWFLKADRSGKSADVAFSGGVWTVSVDYIRPAPRSEESALK